MNLETNERTVLVPLPETLVEALLMIHATLDVDFVGTLESRIADSPQSFSKGCPEKASRATQPPIRKYAAEFLDMRFTAWTLPEVFAEIVDMTAEVAPEALTKLAGMSARRRRYVARSQEAIHPGNRSLPVTRTKSGWWISKNIGQEDLKRALRAICDAAGITFGKDLKFPIHRQSN